MNKTILIRILGFATSITIAVVWLMATPTVGPVNIRPSFIQINDPTTVIVTAKIHDPSLIPASVNLYRINAMGSPDLFLGRFNDAGLDGDAIRGDGIYTIRLTMNESDEALLVMKASAAFRGVLRRSMSDPIFLAVSRDGALPPDPGKFGEETLVGLDLDDDGTRDDIQRYIALSYSGSEKLRAALTQYAKAAQSYLLPTNSHDQLIQLSRNQDSALDCLIYIVGLNETEEIHSGLLGQLLNTDARSKAYIHSDAQLSGQTVRITPPEEEKLGCKFDPDAMEN